MLSILNNVIWGNTIENWAITLLIVGGAVLAAKLFYWIFSKFFKAMASKTTNKLDDILVDMLEEPVVFAVMIIGLWWGYEHLEFTENIQMWAHKIFKVMIAINITWLLARLVDALMVEYFMPAVENTTESANQFLPIVRKGLRSLIWIIGFIMALNNAGYDVAALLAGVGIGGIAMAMAAKDFVANIFGGITVFVDKPFKVGDRIQLDGYDGFVTEIGIRSTRIKTFPGRIITVPNHKFTDSYVENVSIEPWRRVKMTLGLEYSTTRSEIEKGIQILKDIILDHKSLEDEHFVIFDSFGDFSLNITMIYFIIKDEDILEIQSQVNLEILEKFNAAGLGFAFPTQTVFHKEIGK
jgi:MscS family membrane protein